MTQKTPGRSHRQGMTGIHLPQMFPDDATAEEWFGDWHRPEGRNCPPCDSAITRVERNRNPVPYRCRDCPGHCSVNRIRVMQSRKFGLSKWAIARYMMTTRITGTSNMKMYREPGNRQMRVWCMMQRTREGLDADESLQVPGPIKVVESHFVGKERNRHVGNKPKAGCRPVRSTAIAGARDRESNTVRAEVVEKTDRSTPHGSVAERVAEGAKANVDEATAYNRVSFDHENVGHSLGGCADGIANMNGLESFRALLNRGYHGMFRHVPPQLLNRYVREWAARPNIRDLDTIEQMTVPARGMVGKRFKCRELVGKAGVGR